MLRLLAGRHRNAKILALSLALLLVIGAVLPLVPTAAVAEPTVTGDSIQNTEEPLNLAGDPTDLLTNNPEESAGDTVLSPDTDAAGDTETGSLNSASLEGETEEGNFTPQFKSQGVPVNSQSYDPPELQVQSQSGLVNSEVMVDLTLLHPGEAVGYRLTLDYDPAILALVVDQQGDPVVESVELGGMPVVNGAISGQLQIAAASAESSSLDLVRLCTLHFFLLSEGSSVLEPTEVEIYDQMANEPIVGVTLTAGNIQSSYPTLTVPQAAPAPGNYSTVQRVSLKTAIAQDFIYFTLDNSDPASPENAGRQLYSSPILVNCSQTIKAVIFREGLYGSLSTFDYTINLAGISGKVSYRGQPVTGTSVKVKRNGVVLNTVNTNAIGDYVFPALQDGSYVVVAGGSGGFNAVESQAITLDSQTRQAVQNFELFKGGTITGVVQVPEGYSSAGIPVFAQSDSTGSYVTCSTEQDGTFWLEALKPAGDYQVFTRNDLGLIDASIPTTEAPELIIAAGQLTTLTDPLVLGSQQLATLSGTASEVDNQQSKTPMGGMWISVYSPSTNCWGGDDTDDTSGQYRIENLTPADDYLISYYKWDDNISGTLENVADISGETTIDIDVPTGYQITGTVSVDNGSGEPELVKGIGVWVSGPNWGSAMTNEAGEYTIKHLLAGTYTVEVDLWNRLEVDSRTEKTVTVDVDYSSVTHNIVLIPGGIIAGKVTTNPLGGQDAVQITASSANQNIYRRATTDKDGNYIIRGISPADDYVVSAWKWPYNPVELTGVQVIIDAQTPVVDLVLNHPDLQAGYFKPEGNRFLAMNPSITPGKVASFKLDYQNCNPSQPAAGAIAEFILPAGLVLVSDSVPLNGVTLNGVIVESTTRTEGDKTIIAVSLGDVDSGQKGNIVFQVRHQTTSNAMNFTSQALIKWGDHNETIGSAQIEVVAVDINGPSFTKPGKFTVYGKSADSAQVKVMAKKAGSADILLGQARAEGKWWTTSVNISSEGTYQLYAIAEKNGSTSDPSSPITIEIKDNTAVLDDVTINAGWNLNVKSNPKIGIPAIAVSQGYTVNVDAIFTNPLDTSLGNPQLLFAVNDESIDLSKATPAEFQVTGTMSSSELAGEQKNWSGSFDVNYTLSGDLKAYIYYYTNGAWHLVPVVQIAILIDPSGIITDAHSGKPIQGVRAECEYEVAPDDWQHWPAENFGQVNPQFTDDTGHYGWDVPTGTYRVRFTHANYDPTISETVYVPPPKTDLDLGLTSLTAGETPGIKVKSPEDVDVQLDSVITVEFTKDMKAESVTGSSFILKDGMNTPVEGSISGTGSLFTFTPTSGLTADTTYTVQLTADIKDSFENPIEPAEWSFTTITGATTVINVAPQLTVYARSTANRNVNVSFTGTIIAQTLPTSVQLQIAAQANPNSAIKVLNANVVDGKFNASWLIPADLEPGMYTVKVFYNGSHYGNHSFEVIVIEKPAATPSNSNFDTQPLTVELSCVTAEAVIYYTLDGTVPDITNPAYQYTGPIMLEHSATIKAIAVKKGVSSELATFSYNRTDECFIATASFGSKFVPAVVLLRQFRDKCLLTNSLGRAFVEFYYQNSPPIAHFIADRSVLKFLVRGLLTPAIGIAYLALHPQFATIIFSVLFPVLLVVCIYRRRREQRAT